MDLELTSQHNSLRFLSMNALRLTTFLALALGCLAAPGIGNVLPIPTTLGLSLV